MASQTEKKELAKAIRNILEKEMVLTRNTLAFIESTTGIVKPSELTSILNDREHEERDILLEFIFFPNSHVRLKIEPLLQKTHYTKCDESELTDQINNCILHAKLGWPDRQESRSILLPKSAISKYVARLYISRNADPEITRTLTEYLTESESSRSKIAIRCKNIKRTKKNTRFLCRFIRKASSERLVFMNLFDLVLDLLNQTSDCTPVEEHIYHEREKQINMYNKVLDFQKQMNQYSMEYLMMSGYNVPPDSLETVTQKINLLNIILDKILDKPFDIYKQDPVDVDPTKDMEKIFRLFS